MNLRKMHLRDLMLSIITVLIILNLQILTFGDFRKPIQYITAIVGIGLFLFCALNRPVRYKITKYSRLTSLWMVLFFAFLGVELFYGLLASSLSFRVVASKFYIFLWILLYYPILYLMSFQDTRKKLFHRIFYLTLFAMIMKTFIWYQYNYQGKVLMYYILFENGEGYLRRGLQRLGTTALTGWLFSASVWLFSRDKKNADRFFSIALIAFNLWYAQFVFASRAQVIVLCLCVFFVAIAAKKRPLKTIFVYTLVFASIVVILNSQYYAELIQGLSVQTYSISTRFEALSYYFGLVKSHILFGISAISDMDTIRGSAGRFYFSDLGIASKFFEFGIIGLIIFILPIIRIGIQGVFKISREDSAYTFAACLAFYTFVFSVLSNDIYSWSRLFALPFILAYFDSKVGGRIHENT